MDYEKIKKELKRFKKYCPECESFKVGQMCYANINNDEILDTIEPTTYEEAYKCFDCGLVLEFDEILITQIKEG